MDACRDDIKIIRHVASDESVQTKYCISTLNDAETFNSDSISQDG